MRGSISVPVLRSEWVLRPFVGWSGLHVSRLRQMRATLLAQALT